MSTVAFGMGMNLVDVEVIIHLGVEGIALTYCQERGRSARDGGKELGILYLYARSLFLCCDDKMKLFVKLPLVTVLKYWTCSDFHISLLTHTKNHATIHVISVTVIIAHVAQIALNSVIVQEM